MHMVGTVARRSVRSYLDRTSTGLGCARPVVGWCQRDHFGCTPSSEMGLFAID